MKRKHPVRYLTKKIEASHLSLINQCGWKTIHVESKSVNRYYGTTALLLSLSWCARSLLDFSLEEMNEKNVIVNDKHFKKKFNRILLKMRGREYSSGSINKAFGELVDSQLVRNMKKRGAYKISPLFFFSGTDEQRDSQITWEFERPIKALANRVRKEMYRLGLVKKEDIYINEED